MADKKDDLVEATASKVEDNRVEVYIPRGTAAEDPNYFVSINGVSYVLPKGQRVKVPPFVKAEIDRAENARITRDNNAAKLAEESKK